jgi:pimeloyl-ACP methyl ester carboxylesterase
VSRPSLRVALAAALIAAAAACSTPVGVERADSKNVQRALTRSELSSGQLSRTTANELYRWGLAERFDKDPEGAIAVLRLALSQGLAGRGTICALAELSFRHADQSRKRSYYLAAVVYAYAFLFPADPADQVDPLDPRLRLAADLYNLGLAKGFQSADGREVELRGGRFDLPFGELAVSFDPANLTWGSRTLSHFVAVADLQVHGLPTRYRQPGIGAPLAASTEPLVVEKGFDDFVEPWVKVPVTALLRFDVVQRQIVEGRVTGTLTLEPAGDETARIAGREVPLESETTASLAYTLAESPLWAQEIKGFLSGVGVVDEKSQLAALSPYKPGRIPAVFVHGTASSAARWAQMINELSNDRDLRGRYQFWLFSYDTGNPIAYSGMLLRESLRAALAKLDPEGADPALRRMVVIGHSQGGLLTKMTAIESGDGFWNTVSKAPFEKVDFPPKTRDLLARMVFVHPLPFVRRVIFVSTPQHGSYFAGNRASHLMARFITFPIDMVHLTNDLLLRNEKTMALISLKRLPTAVDNMTPGNPFIVALASMPVAPGVHAHSIIAVRGDGPIETGNDGIVEYESAHIEPVDSEFVVRSAHSCQDNPHTIEEVRRILTVHLTERD